MRNLKKVLSLVLCLAMMLSIMVVGAGAAFGDQDKIENAEAVDMCVALGIIDGFEDGNYHPEKNITRAQAAKLISVMVNGGKDAVKDVATSSYTDVLKDSSSAWANKYVEFCSVEGIVAGVGGGRFAPAANLTGTQLAKMLLVALGYDAEDEGFLGGAWALNVNTKAAKVGLYAGLEDVDVSVALSRDDAAQMIWNALNVDLGRGKTLLSKVFGAETDTGILTHIDYNQDTGVYTYYLGEMKDAHDKNGTHKPDPNRYYRTTADYTDLFAQKVTVLAKGDKALGVHSVYGDAAIVVSDVWGNVSAVGNTHFNTIKVSGVKYTLDNVAKDWPSIFDESNMVAYNDYDNNFFVGYNHDPITAGGKDARVSLVYDAKQVHGEYEQYSFVGIDQDGGGDIDIFVVYPYAVLKTENVKNDAFVAREIVNRDASMTVNQWEQDRYMIAGILLDGFNKDFNYKWLEDSMKAEIEFDDIQTVGTIQAYDYVKVTPAVFTAENIDIYEDLDLKSEIANSLSSKDLTVTLGKSTFDGNLLEQLDAFRQIALKKTYSYIEVNGYLFVVDGNALVPELSQFVVVTKVGNHTTTTDKVDNVFKTQVLTTEGETMTVEVSATINSWGHHNPADWFVQEGNITGIDKCPYCDECGKPVVGSLYYIQPNDDGYYYLAAVPCFSTATNWTSIFDFGQAYIDGATLNSAGRWYPGFNRMDNHGLNNMIVDTAAGVAFKNYFNPADSFVVEDNAPIFVYNRNLDTYQVVKGSDLDAKNISGWAFTGATFKSPVITTEKRIATVDLGYVMVENNPVEKTILAYVDGNAIRTVDKDGKYVISVDVITADGEKTLTTDASVLQNNLKFQRLYACLKDGGMFELIVDGDTLVDIKDYHPLTTGTVTAAATVNGKLQLTIGGTTYFVTADTTYIAVSADAPETAMGIEVGDMINFVANADKELTSIIF
ncbi:MAG: S-layer homology domain-containing protein [Evtepia sp.]|nr:S-layer homology domain-containing protein [Evtepia sp.]